MAIEAALQTDYRVRGYSVSDGEPAASVSLTYDDPSGIYLGASASGFIWHGDPELLGMQANIGYARRVSAGVSIEGGVSHTRYLYAFGTSQEYHYTELYLGASIPNFTARVSYSPAYYFPDTPTLYAELDGGIEPASDWFLSAHVGALTYLDTAPYQLPRRRYDWRVGATRQFGRLGLHVDVSGRLQGRPYGYAPPGIPAAGSDGTAVVFGVTQAF